MKSFFGNIENTIINRKKCHGYKHIKFDEGVETGSVITMETEDDTLLIKATGEQPVVGTQYTFLTREFGLYGGDLTAKVSIIFCDDGLMLVTLKEGSILITHEDQILQPAVGGDTYPPVYTDEILWVNADTLLSGKKYFGDDLQQVHWQDFEYVFTLSGGIKNGLRSFKCKHHYAEYIDLSLGYIDEMHKVIEKRQEAKSAKNMMDMFQKAPSTGFVFDDDDEEDYSYEDDDDDADAMDFGL